MGTRLKEQWDANKRKMLGKSAVAEHAWEKYHNIKSETAVLTQARRHKELGGFHFQRIHTGDRLNHDIGLEFMHRLLDDDP